MKKQILGLMLAVLLVSPVTGFAMKNMDHGDMKGMDHGDMKSMDHGDMKMDGNMIMLQNEEVEGVMASSHLLDVKEKMAEHGMAMTHHLMVTFKNKAGEGVTEGQVAVKVESPDDKVSDAIPMMGMDGGFGADVNLDLKGMYHFKIGTKLADGTKRMYHMHYENQ